MKGKNKNIKTDLSGFIRYRNGEMTGSESNDFERELQKNDFLEEAQEGLESLPAFGLEKDLSLLGRRLKNRTKRKRAHIIYRIAASIAVLMIVSSVFIVLEKNKREAPVTFTEEEPAPLTIARSEPLTQQKQTLTEEKNENIERSKNASSVPEAAEKQDMPAENPIMKNEQEPPQPEPKSAEAPAISEQRYAAADETVSAVRSARAGGIAYQNYKPAEPETGKVAYENYIDENIRRPDSSRQRAVVVTGFTVKTDGSIDSIKILRSPGIPFSREAIRLIKSGPHWKPALRNGIPVDDSVSLKIMFK